MSFNFKNPSKLFAWYYSLLCPFYGRKFYKKLLKVLELNGDESILDFGSGAGVLAKKVIKYLRDNGQLTCLDTSSAFLNKAHKKLKNYDNVEYLLGDIRDLKIQPNSFDVIISSWVIHHISPEDRKEIIEKFASTLKQNGRVLLIEYCKKPHGISEDEVLELFNNAFLKISNKHQEKNTVLFEFRK
ncbi:MAG: class I SAM-dependent methyltransferase [Candidatus Lokiarchaeota archaeon]|nr:class I SAM-dependent methyltransferase [Candidatus Lokiarchaeota archaeon]